MTPKEFIKEKLIVTKEDWLRVMDDYAKHILSSNINPSDVIGCFSADEIKDVYEIGRAHERNNSDCTSEQIKQAWIRADRLYKTLKDD